MNTHCKIGKIKPKDKKISVVSTAKEANEDLKVAMSRLRQCWNGIDEVTGYFLVTWDKNGGFYRSLKVGEDSAIPMTLLPSWISEVARRCIMADEAEDVMNGKI